MRLGIDATNLREGGGVRHLIELLRAAEPADHGFQRVTVWAGRTTLEQLPQRRWLEARTDPALDGALPRRTWWQLRMLAAEATRTSDVLLVPGGTYGGAFRPFVVMFRNMLPFARTERRRYGVSTMRAKLEVLRYTQHATFARADGVIVLTEHARELMGRVLGSREQRVTVIPHGIDPGLSRAPRAQRPLSAFDAARPWQLLYVSKIDWYKHQWVVAEAVAGLRREGLPLELRLVGDAYGPAARRLHSVLDRLDPTRTFIRYDGLVSRQELSGVYAAADAFIFASTCENLPNILIEAMAAGLPVACADRRPMPDVLGPDGVYFDAELLESTARAIRTLATDERAREQNAKAAFARARAFSWERCARDTFAFLRDTARAAPRTVRERVEKHA